MQRRSQTKQNCAFSMLALKIESQIWTNSWYLPRSALLFHNDYIPR
jgi:hypothetical protein